MRGFLTGWFRPKVQEATMAGQRYPAKVVVGSCGSVELRASKDFRSVPLIKAHGCGQLWGLVEEFLGPALCVRSPLCRARSLVRKTSRPTSAGKRASPPGGTVEHMPPGGTRAHLSLGMRVGATARRSSLVRCVVRPPPPESTSPLGTTQTRSFQTTNRYAARLLAL